MPIVAVPTLWGSLTAVLANLVRTRIGGWIAAAAAAYGVAVVAQRFAVEPVLGTIQQHVNGLPADALAWAAFLGFDEVITIVLSAYAASSALSALRIRLKPAT